MLIISKRFFNISITELVLIIYARVPDVRPIMYFLFLFDTKQEDATFKTCYE